MGFLRESKHIFIFLPFIVYQYLSISASLILHYLSHFFKPLIVSILDLTSQSFVLSDFHVLFFMFSQSVLESHIPLSESFFLKLKSSSFLLSDLKRTKKKYQPNSPQLWLQENFLFTLQIHLLYPWIYELWSLLSGFFSFGKFLLLIQTLTFLSPDLYKPKSEVLPLLDDQAFNHIRHSLKIQKCPEKYGQVGSVMHRIVNFNGKHHRSSSDGEFVQMTKCKKKKKNKKFRW